jgi:PAS domain S-box-containing protein
MPMPDDQRVDVPQGAAPPPPRDPDRSDEKLRTVVSYLAQGQRLSSTGVWVWNPFTDHHFASAQAYRLFGFTADEATAVTVQDFPLRVHPEDRDRFERAILDARSRLTDFQVGYRVVYPDGAVRHMHAIGHPVTSSTGEVREFIGTVVDVTERRLAEEAQARQARDAALRVDISAVLTRETGLRSMLQGCAEAFVRRLDVAFARIWTLAPGSRVLALEASAGLYTHLDGPHSRVPVGELKIGLIARERRPHLTNDVANDPRVSDQAWAARETMVSFAGYPLVVADRVVGVMAMFGRQPIAPETIETLGSIADAIAQGIERKRSEDALRRSEAYLVEGQRLSQTGSWAWNVKTGDRYWSREVFRIHGFEPADAPPPANVVRNMTPPPDLDAWDRTLETAVRERTDFELDSRIRLADGSLRYLHLVGHPVLDDTGAVAEYIGTVVDVTDRRRAERRLRRAIRARFEAVLAERLRLARDMHDGLLQDVTGLALQLRAVLPHVETRPNETSATLQRILELAERTSREARQAVVGMRSSATSTGLADAVEQVARAAARSAPITVSMTVTGRPRPVRRRLHEVIVAAVREAVTNVVKHARARQVVVVLAFRSRRCRVSVTDDGNGFDVERPVSGHFGLLGMRERADGSGGALSVESAIGCGTVVSLDVPYRAPRRP